MSYNAHMRFAYFVGFVTLVTVAAATWIEFGPGPDIFGALLPQVAWWANAEPFFACIAFLLAQGVGGRAIVPMPGTTEQDVWPTILIVGAMAPSLGMVALAPKGALFSSRAHLFVTMFTIVLCVVTRYVQLRFGARSGAVLPNAARLH